MKKVLILLLLLIPGTVKAEVDYKITDYYVEAVIDIAGSMSVREVMVMDGVFNGNEVELVYKNSSLPSWVPGNINLENSSIYNGSSITNISFGAKYVKGNIDFAILNEEFDTLESVSSASLGDKGVYTEYYVSDGLGFRLYYPAVNQRVAFYSEYAITNVVVIHNDVAELFWPFLQSTFRDDIENVNIRVLLPDKDDSDDYRIWAHGSLTGVIWPLIDNSGTPLGALMEIESFKAGSSLDIRMIFNKDLIMIQEFNNKSGINAKNKIIELETKKADEANKQREAIKRLYYTTVSATVIYFIFLVLLWVYIYIKFDKEYRSDFKAKYYREFINDYDVEVIDYLMKKSITPNAMSASIMNLIYKKNISVEALDKKGKHYIFTRQNEDKLSDNETYLMDFLFNKVGEGSQFTTKDLKKYAGGSATYSEFTTNYNSWKNKVVAQGVKEEFYESNTKIKIAGFIYAILGFAITIFTINRQIEFYPAYVACVPALAFLVYIITFNKKTLKGNEHYLKWNAFKRFLLDFSILPKRELPEIKIWERYMVYATVLGVAKQVSKAMNVRIKEFEATSIHTPMFNTYMYMNMSSNINRAVSSAVRESINKATANSVSSSGSGFGGGFSGGGGGGFGGGGRGGGGF